MKAIEVGACDYWNKPLEEKRIVNMWAYVLKSSTSEDTKQKDIGSQKDDDRRRVKSDNSEFASSVVDFDVGESKNANPPSRKKKRIVWSTELHELFLIAMDKAGGEGMTLPQFFLSVLQYLYFFLWWYSQFCFYCLIIFFQMPCPRKFLKL